jgi:hypothetical protein
MLALFGGTTCMRTKTPKAPVRTFAALMSRHGNRFGFLRLALAAVVTLSHSGTLG